jgi:cell division protein FtsB
MKRKIFVLGVACLLLIMIVTAVFGKKGVMDLGRYRRELAARMQKIKDLEAEKDRLAAEIRLLESDPRAVEKEAREKLGLAAPGEKVVIDPAPPVKK